MRRPAAPAGATAAAQARPGRSQARVKPSIGLTNVEKLLERGAVRDLKKGVNTARAVLRDITPVLRGLGNDPQLLNLIVAVTELQKKKSPRGPVIGVMGSTGAGKSSVINAMLDEESLVPTNCMRACTSVITEMSYNESDDNDKKYRAEVEFVDAEAWGSELSAVFGDIAESDFRDQDVDGPDADIQLAKVKAVYPLLDKDSFSKGLEMAVKLIHVPEVMKVLGTTISLSAKTAESLNNQLQVYIDSNEKVSGDINTGKGRGNQMGTRDANNMAFWPLVKVVRIYTKAEVLRNGLILVDLPGSYDSNAARSAVADNYMKDCHGTWIVAPIARAVDDKVAYDLMGASFRQQLKLDGKFSTITMICSKTDIINEAEAAGNFKHDVTLQKKRSLLAAQIAEAKQAKKQKDTAIQVAKRRQTDTESAIRANFTRSVALNKVLRSVDQKENMIPVPKSLNSKSNGKRKLGQASLPSAKRLARLEISDSQGEHDNADDLDDDGPATVQLPRDDVHQELNSMDQEDEELQARSREIDTDLKTLTAESEQLTERRKNLECQSLKSCIQTRNHLSKTEIKKHYSSRVREMDEMDDDDDDDDGPSASKEGRDYGKVVDQLNVFCVSTYAYMVLTGKIQDEPRLGFESTEDTQIPCLRQHAVALAEAFRVMACRQFLSEFLRVIRMLVATVIADETPLRLGDNVKRQELLHLAAAVNILEADFAKAEKACTETLLTGLAKIFKKLTDGVDCAKEQAEETLANLFKKKSEGPGGVSFQTFRAMCQPGRNGVFQTGAGRHIDLNEELTSPFKETILQTWGDVLTTEYPAAVDALGRDTAAMVAKFRNSMTSREQLDISLPSVRSLVDVIESTEDALKDTKNRKSFISTAQMDANRLITNTLREHMTEVYKACIETEKGQGRYKRMKTLVLEHVTAADNPMFAKTAQAVHVAVRAIVQEVRKKMSEEHNAVVAVFRQKYSTVITGIQIFAAVKETRAQLRVLLEQVDTRFVLSRVKDAGMVVDGAADNSNDMNDVGMADGDDHREKRQVAIPSKRED